MTAIDKSSSNILLDKYWQVNWYTSALIIQQFPLLVTAALLNAIEGSACLQFYLLDGGLLGSQGILSALHSADLYTARKTLYNSIFN